MRNVLYFFGEINDQDIDWLIGAGTKEVLREGDVLISQGEPISVLSFVLNGRLTILVGQKVVAELSVGDVVGELSFLDSRPPSASVVAAENTAIFSVPATRLRSKLKTDTGFASRFYKGIGVSLAHRLRETTSQFGYGAQAKLSEDNPNELDVDQLDRVSLAAARFDEILQKLLKQ